MSKRQKFVIATFVLLAGIILSRAGLGVFLQWRFRVVLFALASIAVTIWALKDEDFNGVEWLTLPILPAMFALGSALAFPLLPSGFDTIATVSVSSDTSMLLSLAVRLLFLAGFVVGYYASILTANIYNVAAIRNIQLLRVAHSIGFLVTVASALLLYIVLFSFHLSGFLDFFFVMLISGPLIFQAVWSATLEEKIGERTINYSFIATIILGEVAWILSFWPVGISIVALFLTAIFYEMVGIIQYHFDERLNRRIANEFVFVAVFVFLITIFAAQWGG
ncbi:hypothetical protein M1403_00290 [Patescibacteria group bacterium]|nr:hypothetical protein [Patescibacteria group bacterium]